jgi:hypothetical protein
MSLRIAFDCDGVLADMDSAVEAIAARLFGPDWIEPGTPPAAEAAARPAEGASDGEATVTPGEEQVEPERIHRLTRRQRRDIWEEVRRTANFWETLQELEPGVVARLSTLATERAWEVIFITQRPASGGDTTQRQTQRWLVGHGFECPAVFVTRGSRGKVADALSLDVLVDDRPQNCLDVKLESTARALLVWRRDPATLPPNARRLGIEPVPSVGACLDILTAEPAGQTGFLARMRKIVGG